MFVKLHEPNDYQKFLLAAEHRMNLNDHDYHKLFTYIKGFEGESYFYKLINDTECVKLWDISLDYRKGSQYDFLIFDKGTLYHFDVKNFTGSYQLVDRQFVSEKGNVHTDVVSQLSKAHHKLESFLKSQQIKYQLVSRVLFVNHDYRLSTDTIPKSVLLPHQVDEVVHYIQSIEPLQEHRAAAEKILAYHNNELVQERIHYYPFDNFKGGIRCGKCRRLSMIPDLKKKYICCTNCHHRVNNKTALCSLILEMSLLKNDSLSAAEVRKWSGMPLRTVQRMMSDSCHKQGQYKNMRYHLK
ncbi:nuclease-related domain-containing protein [Macrococcus lamae]|uniref:NERD domain-containing protein n=1 Tax=Macrococcus lamae TaxID=198484 RepID=A0A4R6BV01_9STAP|nr:nuclease-related domain-containing protein [Macrococcus lamae]TDM12091.1 NERD domain-containing protein [Macrococcus lamae]